MTSPWGRAAPERLEARLVIEADGTVVARSGKVEYGQNIRAGFARIVARALDVPLARVRVELGETDRVPWDMGTFGSMSTATDGKKLRLAAAYARTQLLSRAAERLGVDAAELSTGDGAVRAPDGRTVHYADLVAGAPLEGQVPEEAPAPSSAADGAPLRIEGRDIVTGRVTYAGDVRLPGMLRAAVRHPPVPGAHLASVDDDDARAMPGVVEVIQDGDLVAVLAERFEQARAAADALDVEWTDPAGAGAPSFDEPIRDDDGVDAAFEGAARILEARYEVPHVTHAPIGPSAAVADVKGDGADLYVATQRPFGLRDSVAELLDVAPEQVHVHPQAMGGMYGRGSANDAPMEAARISKRVGRPVLVQWTRAEEFQMSPHRPRLDASARAGLDAGGGIVAWHYHTRTNPHTYGGGGAPARVVAMTSGRNAVPPYRLGRARVRLEVVPGEVRTGAFRSLAAAPNVFANESFLDELACASGQDPVAFRLRHLEDERLRRVLETVAERSAFASRPGGDGRGLGVACTIYHGTYVAEACEVEVTASGEVRLLRVWAAVDPGRLVHPDGARNQIEGGIQQAASWTLRERLAHDGARVTTRAWPDYPIARFADAPAAIDVVFLGEASAPSTGIGEPGSVPVAAAIANAVFAASGVRVRRLPITREAIRAAAADRS